MKGRNNKKRVSLTSPKKMKGRKNKRSATSTSSKRRRRRRSQDVKILFNHELKDMKTLRSNDEAFHLSLMKIIEIIDLICSRKTPVRKTYMQWDEYAISFYLKMCICFGVDYQHLEATSEDGDDENGKKPLKEQHLEATSEDDDDENGKKPLKEQEEHMACSGVKLRLTKPKPMPSEEVLKPEEHMESSGFKPHLTKRKMMSVEEFLKRTGVVFEPEICCIRSLTGPLEFGSYSSGTSPDCIPYHLYLLVKEAVDIMNSTNDLIDLTIVEKKIRFFCTYFHSHLPTGWNYNRDKASSLISGYDITRKPTDFMSGYTPFEEYRLEALDCHVETCLSPCDAAEVMIMIYSRITPSFWMMYPEMIAFYCKLCSCFGIKDYHRLEAASEDDVCLMKVGLKPGILA